MKPFITGRKHLTRFLVLSCVLATSYLSAETIKRGQGNPFIIGYLNHPRVKNFYKPIIENAYKEIGISVRFEPVGGERGMRLLSKEMTDADVIRYDVVTQNSNIIAVGPVISRAGSYLFCVHSHDCHKDVIDNPDNAIAVTTRFYHNMQKTSFPLAANILEFDDFNRVVTLLINGRFNYAILPADEVELDNLTELGFSYTPLVEYNLVHVIHKKHAHLQQQIARAIENQLNHLNQ